MRHISLITLPTLLSLLLCGGAMCRHTTKIVEPQLDSVKIDVVATTEPSCELDPPLPQPRPIPRKILVVGDSEACTVGPHLQHVADKIDDELGLPHDKIALSCKDGTTVQYWGLQGHLQEALGHKFQPDTVVIFLGTNHFGSTSTPPVSPIINLVKQRDLTCVWVGNTAVRGRHWPVNDLLRKAVTPTCTYFDTEDHGVDLVDGAHPGPVAAVLWLEAVWRMIPKKYEESHEK